MELHVRDERAAVSLIWFASMIVSYKTTTYHHNQAVYIHTQGTGISFRRAFSNLGHRHFQFAMIMNDAGINACA